MIAAAIEQEIKLPCHRTIHVLSLIGKREAELDQLVRGDVLPNLLVERLRAESQKPRKLRIEAEVSELVLLDHSLHPSKLHLKVARPNFDNLLLFP